MAKIRTFNADELASLKMEGDGNLLVSSGLQDSQRFAYTPDFNMESFTKRNIPIEFQNYDVMQEARAQRQSAVDQLANGIGKMGVLAGTTFADGILGTIVGTLNVGVQGVKRYAEGDEKGFEFSDFWNNPVSQALQDLNAKSEEWMPNYRTRAEEDSFWLNRAFGNGAANFWGDTFLKNLGFTMGALGSAAFTMGVGAEVTGVKAAAQALRQGLTPQNTLLMKELAKATGKNSFKNTDEIVAALLKTDIKAAGPLLKELQASAKALAKLERNQMLAGSLLAAQGEARIEAIHGAKEYEEKRVKELVSQGYSEEQAELQAHQESLSVGNLTFGLNMPILTYSNFIQFGKMFRGGYNPNKVTSRITGNIGDVLRGKGAVEAGKIGKLETARRVLRPAFTEGVVEEMGQAFASEFAGNYISRRNNNSEQNAFISSITDGFMDTYGNIDRWEEGFVGGLTGLLGMPNFGKLTSKTKRADKGIDWWAGGMADEFSQIRKENEKSKKVADTINSMSGSMGKLYSDNNVQSSIEKDKVHAAIHNDERTYKTLENEGLTHHVATMIDAGRYNDLIDFLDSFEQMDAKEIRGMMVGKNDKNEPVDPYQNFTDEQLKTYMVNRAKKIKENAQTINQLKEAVETKFSGLSEDAQMEMLRYASNINDIEKRIGNLFNIYQSFALTGIEADKAFKTINVDEFKENIEKLFKKQFLTLDSKEFEQAIKNTIDDLKKSVKKGLTPMQNEELNRQITDLVQLAFDRAKFISLYTQGAANPEGLQQMIDEHNKEVEKQKESIVDTEEKAIQSLTNKLKDAGYSPKLEDNILEEPDDDTLTEEQKQEKALKAKPMGIPVLYKGSLGFLRRVQKPDGKTELQIVSENGKTLLTKLNKETLIKEEANIQVIPLADYREYKREVRNFEFRTSQIKALEQLIEKLRNDYLTNKEQSSELKEFRNQLYEELNNDLESFKTLSNRQWKKKREITKRIKDTEKLIEEVEAEIYALEQQKELVNEALVIKNYLEEVKADPNFTPISQKISALRKALYEKEEILKQDLDELKNLDELILALDNQSEAINNQLEALYEERVQLVELAKAFVEIQDNNESFSYLLRVLPQSLEFRNKYPDALIFFNPNLVDYAEYRSNPKMYKKYKAFITLAAKKAGITEDKFLKQFNKDLGRVDRALLSTVEQGVHDDFFFITEQAINDITNKINNLEKLSNELAQKKMNAEDKVSSKLADISFNQGIISKLSNNLEFITKNAQEIYSKARHQLGILRTQNTLSKEDAVQQAEQPEENKVIDTLTQNFVTDIVFGTTGLDTQYELVNNKYQDKYDSDGNPIPNPNPDAQRWMKWINTIGPDNIMEKGKPKYKVRYVNATELSSIIGRPITDKDGNVIDGDEDLFVLILDNNTPVKQDGEIVFTSLFKTSTIRQEGRVNLKKITDDYLEEKKRQGNLTEKDNIITITEGGVAEEFTRIEIEQKVAEQLLKGYEEFRQNIISKKGKIITSPIIGISNGIPLMKKDKTKSPLSKLGLTLGKNSEVFVQTQNNRISPGIVFPMGTILIKDTNTGDYIPAQSRTTTDKEVNTILQLINLANSGQALGEITVALPKIGDKDGFLTFNGTPTSQLRVFPGKKTGIPNLLSLLINYGVNDIKVAEGGVVNNQEIYINTKTKSISFAFDNQGYTLALSDVLDENKNGMLKEFLKQKRTNVNVNMLQSKNKFYFHPIYNENTKQIEFKTYSSKDGVTGYEIYLQEIMQTSVIPSKSKLSHKKLKLSNNALQAPVITEETEKVTPPQVTETQTNEDPYNVFLKLNDGTYEVDTKKGAVLNFTKKGEKLIINNIQRDGEIFATTAFNEALEGKTPAPEGLTANEYKVNFINNSFISSTIRELKEGIEEPTVSADAFFESEESSLPQAPVSTDAKLQVTEKPVDDNQDFDDFALVEVSNLKTLKDYIKKGIVKQEC
jgi:gas vesicle protein